MSEEVWLVVLGAVLALIGGVFATIGNHFFDLRKDRIMRERNMESKRMDEIMSKLDALNQSMINQMTQRLDHHYLQQDISMAGLPPNMRKYIKEYIKNNKLEDVITIWDDN